MRSKNGCRSTPPAPSGYVASNFAYPPGDASAAIGFFASVLEARGYAALEQRVAIAYERFVAPGDAAFRPRGTPVQLGDVLKFEWEYAPLDGSAPTGGGTEFVVLAAVGRIRSDYQFIDG
jgi:hypothetical protein